MPSLVGKISVPRAVDSRLRDVERLNRLAADALTMEYTQKHWKPEERIEVAEDLPLTDCYVAPCVTACAIKQDIPEYIRLLGEHRYADALELL